MGAALLFVIAGIVIGVLPYTFDVPPYSPIIGGLAGLVCLVLGAVLAMLRLFVKSSANQAFVRTGQGGGKPILDGGAFVIPVLHNVIPISLETMKLDVERVGEDALITRDNLRVDVRGEFYIKVDANREDILAAARSLGEKGTHPEEVAKLVFEKLVSALRSVAATMDLVEIHSRREDFAKAVFESVREDLKHNGLTLESVTISRLDQTDPGTLSDDNIFDAQGKKKITEITQSALTERTRLERAAEVERNRLDRESEQAKEQQDVSTRKSILLLEREKAEAEATQATEVANVRAGKEREQQEFKIKQEQQVQEVAIERQRAVEQAKIQQELAVQGAAIDKEKELILREQEKEQTDIQRQQAVQTARIAQEQTVEVARRAQEIAVAEKEAERAKAEQAALEAQAERERANQEVMTVTATSEAAREAETRLIAAKQLIEQDKIKRQTDAEVAAFAVVRDAEGERDSAARRAAARLEMAEAEAKAKERQATADQALRMVDVNVERERVNVEGARVEVERQALENQQTFDKVAVQFEQAKLQIQAVKEVQVALAAALGNFMARGNFQIYGDPTTLSQMTSQFAKGLGFGAMVDGLLDSTPEGVKTALSAMSEQLKPLVEKLTGDGEPAAAPEASEKE